MADKLGKSKTMIERRSRRFDWPARVHAHTAHLADIERKTAEALAVQAGTDWAKRQDQHRVDEWQARGELLALAREAIARWKTPSRSGQLRCGTLEGIARLLDLASKLGRVSSGLSFEPEEKTGEEDAAFMIQIEVALEKIYGPEAAMPLPTVAAPAPVVEVEPLNPPAALPAQT